MNEIQAAQMIADEYGVHKGVVIKVEFDPVMGARITFEDGARSIFPTMIADKIKEKINENKLAKND